MALALKALADLWLMQSPFFLTWNIHSYMTLITGTKIQLWFPWKNSKPFLHDFKRRKKAVSMHFQSFSSSCQIFFVYCQAASWVQYENHLIFLVFALLQQQQFSSCTKGNFSSTTWEMHLHLLLFSAVATASAEVQSSLWVFCTLFQWLQISR